MTREERIIEIFVELANTMADDFDVIEFLHRVAERSVEILDCAEAGLLLADAGGALRVMASSSERADALDALQSDRDEGPCIEAFKTGKPVSSQDLNADFDRWPTFAPNAVQKGFHSVQALPLRVHSETIGALNLFRATTGAIAEADLPLGQGMADIAAIALVQERAIRDAQSVVGQLQSALGSRVIIEQAKGVLAARAGIGVDEAFARVRSHARDNNLRLRDVARDVIGGRLAADLLARADARSERSPSDSGNTAGGEAPSTGGSVLPLSRRSRRR